MVTLLFLSVEVGWGKKWLEIVYTVWHLWQCHNFLLPKSVVIFHFSLPCYWNGIHVSSGSYLREEHLSLQYKAIGLVIVARILWWVAIIFFRGSFQLDLDFLHAGGFLTSWATREASYRKIWRERYTRKIFY